MDFFARLDKNELRRLPEEPIAVVRYRTRFHRDILESSFSVNPAVSHEDVAAAVAINDPPEFLPQPWPPLPVDQPDAMRLAALVKMKEIVNVGIGLPAAHAKLLSLLISHRIPARAAIPTTDAAVTNCEVRITQDGAVSSGFNFPDEPLFGSGTVEFGDRIRYIKAMLILGMQTYLESLTS